MYKKLLFFFALAPILGNAQEFKRRQFEYNPTKIDTISMCSEPVLKQLDEAFSLLEQSKSKNSLEILQTISPKAADCPEFYEVKGFSLFRNGDWLKGIETIETGIEKYGSQPDLIKRKAEMSLEMGELGINKQVIDGKIVDNSNLKFDDAQFKTENFKSALTDLEYLAKNFNVDEDYFYIAKIHQILKNYNESNAILRRLLENKDFKDDARFNLVDNLIQINQLDEAEKEINIMIKAFPEEAILKDVLAEIKEKKK